MIDFHCHILPGIDDGSRDVAMTRELLGLEMEQGVDRIVATPHFYAQQENIKDFLRIRKKSAEATNIINEERSPEIILGAEVYYFPGIGRAEMLKDLCINNGDHLLLEMPFAQWTQDMLRDVEEIVEKRHIRLIMAHVERFYRFQKDPRAWDGVFDLPVIPQINAGALTDWHARRFCLKLLKDREDVLLGTDAHNTSSRKPNMEQGRAVIEKKLGRERLERLDVFSDSIWQEMTGKETGV